MEITKERRTYPSVHVCSTMQENTRVVGPLQGVEIGAVVWLMGAVNEHPVLGDVSNTVGPVPGLLRPLSVCLIARVDSQSSTEVEEAAIGNGVLVVKAIVQAEDLPVQATIAVLHVPTRHLRVYHALGESQPAGLTLRGILKVALRSNHGREAPESLVIIAQAHGLIVWHEVLGG